MLKYDFVFIILVYRNTNDLVDFFNNFNVKNSKVIVVNSYYDESSQVEFERISIENRAEFLSVENKGYGFGNNEGCRYAKSHYEFDYLVISNSDISINNIELNKIYLKKYNDGIIAPKIVTLNNKKQNPNILIYTKLHYDLLLYGYKKRLKILLKLAHVWSRLSRELSCLYMFLLNKKFMKIFSAHGAFFIISKSALNKLWPLFNEKMFLYNEELYLALNARKEGVPVYYLPFIVVTHKEGGSTSTENIQSFETNKKSFMVLHEFFTDNIV